MLHFNRLAIRSVPVPANQKENQWFIDGVKLLKANLKQKPITHTAKNTIFFLGDGMSITTVTASRILEGQMRNQTGEENVLSWENFPWTALSKTYNVDQQVADSAGTATAFLGGVKTDAGKQVITCQGALKRFSIGCSVVNRDFPVRTEANSNGFPMIRQTAELTPALPPLDVSGCEMSHLLAVKSKAYTNCFT